jgi:hypothetical protein
MAKGLITAELTGFKELIQSLKDMPEIAEQAIKAGSEAMMKQGEKDLRVSYYAHGGKQGDYVDRGIGHYGTDEPAGLLEGTDYWTSVGVFQKEGIDKGAITAAQVAYWIENGISRLRSGVRKPSNFTTAAFNPEDLITTSPKPFISDAFIKGWDGQFAAFSVAFNNKVEELK